MAGTQARNFLRLLSVRPGSRQCLKTLNLQCGLSLVPVVELFGSDFEMFVRVGTVTELVAPKVGCGVC